MRPELILIAVVGSGCATPLVGFVPLRGTYAASSRAVEASRVEGRAAIGWVYSSEKEGAPADVKQRAMACAAGAGGDEVVFVDVSGHETETSSFSGSSSLGMLSATTPSTMYAGTVTESKDVAVTRFLGRVYRRDVTADEPVRPRPFLDRLAQARGPCARAEADGCGELGSLVAPDRTRGRDPEEALAMQERACADGDPFACEAAGWQYSSGLFAAPKDEAKARQFRLRGCALGAADACSALGDVARAQALRAQWCAAGSLMSCPENFSYEARLARQTQLCAAGRTEHCFFAALGAKDLPWMKRLCADGDARACASAARDTGGTEGLQLAAEACALGDCAPLEAMLRAR